MKSLDSTENSLAADSWSAAGGFAEPSILLEPDGYIHLGWIVIASQGGDHPQNAAQDKVSDK